MFNNLYFKNYLKAKLCVRVLERTQMCSSSWSRMSDSIITQELVQNAILRPHLDPLNQEALR